MTHQLGDAPIEDAYREQMNNRGTMIAHSFEKDILRMIATGKVRLSAISEPTRQRCIDLAMLDEPLIDMEGDFLTLTRAGLERLKL